MRLLVFFLLALIFTSCSGNGSASQLSGTDSLVINFNEPQSNMIKNVIHTTEKNAIKKIKQFVNGKKAEEFKCGYDGNILFYSGTQLLGDVSFNYSGDGCRHFMTLIDGKLSSTTMSNEAADFLQSLASGKSWY